MNFIPTKECPKLPGHLNPRMTPKPLPALKNHDIDLHLQVMATYPGTTELLPRTQYGRRVAVQMFLRE